MDFGCLLRRDRCAHRSLVLVLPGAILSRCTPGENGGLLPPDISACSLRLRKTVAYQQMTMALQNGESGHASSAATADRRLVSHLPSERRVAPLNEATVRLHELSGLLRDPEQLRGLPRNDGATP
jgi:hypothetical protein